jgi:hypothetical protein
VSDKQLQLVETLEKQERYQTMLQDVTGQLEKVQQRLNNVDPSNVPSADLKMEIRENQVRFQYKMLMVCFVVCTFIKLCIQDQNQERDQIRPSACFTHLA